MIDQRLVDLINSGSAWAFVGSGVSVDAGLPDWQTLYALTVKGLTNQTPEPVELTRLPLLFDKLIRNHGREAVNAQVEMHLSNKTTPGELHALVASWPFRNYVTTNYDQLLDKALSAYQGWISVGNTPPETRRISGEVSNTVWHPHGMVGLPEEKSRLVISQNDYDEVYPAGSLVLEALKAILRMHSLVFIGFGFNDPDLIQLLKTVARLSSPGHPAYAFLSGMSEAEEQEFRVNYNVVAIPYGAPDGSSGDHSELPSLLRFYRSFIVGRDIEIGTRSTSKPNYDPQVTSLIVQNALCRQSIQTTQEIQEQVMRASLVAILSENGSMPETTLEKHIRSSGGDRQHAAFSTLLQRLVADGLVLRRKDKVELTSQAIELAKKRESQAQQSFEQFLSSLEYRARDTQTNPQSESSVRVSEVAADFFQSICKDRGLAIAQNLAGGGELHVQNRARALIQELPKWFSQCHSKTETKALVNVVVGVLSEPRQQEKVYLGFLTQAYFGKHIAGFDERSISIRQQLLAETTFVLDSHFLIYLLAKGCVAHEHAAELFRLLSTSKAPMVATDLILVETVEHLEYAMRKIGNSSRKVSSNQLFEAAQKRFGVNNAFIAGYYKSLADGNRTNFSSYVVDTMSATGSDILPVDMINDAVRGIGICIDRPRDWPLFDETVWHDSIEMEEQIKSRREEHGSYKHDRQVEAEAQVAGIVCAIREGRLRPPGTTKSSQAFFVTQSRILDGLSGKPQRLCIAPSSLYQWLVSTIPFTEEMAANVFDHLLLELIETGVQFVPREQVIRAFGEIVQAGRETIQKVVSEHRTLVEELYGKEDSAEFFNIDGLLVPGAAEHLSMTVLRETRERLALEEAKRRSAEKRIRELERVHSYPGPRYWKRQEAERQKRAAASKPRTRRQRQKQLSRKGNN